MRNETVEIVDSKGQKMRLKISTPSSLGLAKDALLYNRNGNVKVKLTGWEKHIYTFPKEHEGSWKSLDVGFLKYHAGKTYSSNSSQGEVTTMDIYLVNTEGTWGIKLFNYDDLFGVNEAGEGTVVISWVTNLAEGRFSWSLI